MTRHGRAFCFALSLSLLLLTGGDADAHERIGRSTGNEATVRFILPPTPLAATRPTAVTLTVTPKGDFTQSRLKVVTGGVLSLDNTADYQNDTASEPFFPSLPPNFLVRPSFGPLASGKTVQENLVVRSLGSGYGYLTAMIIGKDDQNRSRNLGSVTYYAVSDGRRLFISDAGFLDAEAMQIRASGGSRAEIERKIKQVFRSGAQTSVTSTPAQDPASPRENKATVKGRVMFSDRRGGRHPVRRVQVDVMEDKGGEETVLASGTTDDEGGFAISFPMEANAAKDIFVVAKASGSTVRVQAPGAQQPWAIASATVKVARLGATVNLELAATNLQENNTAFEVYEAANYASQYIAALGGKQPDRITIRFPNHRADNPDGSSTGNGVMHLSGTDAHDWDDIHHEYGHHIQQLYHLADSPAGKHSGSWNLCKTGGRDKDKGIRLAWGEGWPTFFGILMQRELGLKKLEIPSVGDTNYTDTNPAGTKLDYSLEAVAGPHEVGEGNEEAIMRVLWGLYAGRADVTDAVTHSPAELWASFSKSTPRHFSQWWQTFVAGKSTKIIGQYGAVLATQGLASAPIVPVNNAVVPVDSDAEFRWKAVNHCADTGRGEYSLRIYGEDLAEPVFSSPYSSDTHLTVKAGELKRVSGASTRLFWAVVARDNTKPATGEFHGPISALNVKTD